MRAAGGRVVADVPGGQAGGPLRMGLLEGRGAAPKGALLLELDVRGADLPLETVKLPETQRLRCGRAPLLRAAPGAIFTRQRLPPATSFVPEVPPRNAYLHPVLQRHFAASVLRGRFMIRCASSRVGS